MSDILIKGMEMPINCDNCDLMTVEGEYGEPTCPFCLVIRCASEKHPDCPLVEVPPHGRLGDLDAATELVMQYCPDDDGSCSKAGADLRELLDEIETLPTIIPAEEGE